MLQGYSTLAQRDTGSHAYTQPGIWKSNLIWSSFPNQSVSQSNHLISHLCYSLALGCLEVALSHCYDSNTHRDRLLLLSTITFFLLVVSLSSFWFISHHLLLLLLDFISFLSLVQLLSCFITHPPTCSRWSRPATSNIQEITTSLLLAGSYLEFRRPNTSSPPSQQ